MKKIILAVTALVIALNVNAQDSSAKHSVALNEVTTNSNISRAWIASLRAEIMEGLLGTGRVEVLDVTTVEGFPGDESMQISFLSDKDVETFLKCQFNSLNTTRKTNDEGKVSWTTKANYTLTLIDVATGGVKSTNTYEESGFSSESDEKAMASAIGSVSSTMKKFVESAFPLTATIKALDKVHPKKGVESLYITVGSNAGVQEGQPFEVFVETDIAGSIITKKIEKVTVKVKEVVAPNMSLATVSGKGAVELQTAFENGEKVTVVSRPKWNPLDEIIK